MRMRPVDLLPLCRGMTGGTSCDLRGNISRFRGGGDEMTYLVGIPLVLLALALVTWVPWKMGEWKNPGEDIGIQWLIGMWGLFLFLVFVGVMYGLLVELAPALGKAVLRFFGVEV
jgi:hypothetical protein